MNKEVIRTDLKPNWNQILKLNLGDTNKSFKIFFEKFYEVLDKHTPLRKITIQEEKILKKPLDYVMNPKFS